MSYVETAYMKNSTIMLLYSERDEINVSPDYQRMGGVWTKEKKQLLIDSILNDYDIPKIYFHELSNDEHKETGFRYSVIDGRQRLESIWAFMDDKFRLSDNFEYQRDSEINLSSLSYKDIAQKYPKIRIKFDSFVLPIVTVNIEGNDIDLIEDMFSRLNEAVPLNAAEKRNSIGGDLVRLIAEISNHKFFSRKVKFRNNRFQHREAAARFLLIEDSLFGTGQLLDTKKVYLDSLAKKYKSGHPEKINALRTRVEKTLDVMSGSFSDNDELLQAQGILTVYYLIYRTADQHNELNSASRSRLVEFRKSLSKNREAASKDYEDASFDLLEFDRLNQQGTNDASSIKERFRILSEYLGLTESPF